VFGVNDGEPRDPSGDENARPSSYVSRVHLEVIAILLPIFVVLVAVGWFTLPQSTGFSALPDNMVITLTSPSAVNGFSEVLHRTDDNGAVLDIAAGQLSLSGPSWSVGIYDLEGARLCTPSVLPVGVEPDLSVLGPPERVPPQHLSKPDSHGYNLVRSSGPMFVQFCWSSNGPAQLNGPYLNAQFPSVDARSNSRSGFIAVRTTAVLYPNAGNTADYVVQSPTTPTASTADSWRWTSTTTSAASTPRLSAVSTSASQHQTFRAFLSGIALGLAGGALIAILLELVGPISRARDARHPG
jgi:hypothetical protein